MRVGSIEWWNAQAAAITSKRETCRCGSKREGVYLTDPRQGRAVVARCLSCKRTEYKVVQERDGQIRVLGR